MFAGTVHLPMHAMKKKQENNKAELCNDLKQLNAQLKYFSTQNITQHATRDLPRSNCRRSLCETKNEICVASIFAANHFTQEADEKLNTNAANKEPGAFDLYLKALNLYIEAYYKEAPPETLYVMHETIFKIVTLAQRYNLSEVSGLFLHQKLITLKKQLELIVNKETESHDRYTRRVSAPHIDIINKKLNDAKAVLDKESQATNETEAFIKSDSQPNQTIIPLIEFRIKICYQALATLFLIHEEINQSEESYHAIENAVDLICTNNKLLSQVTPHEWAHEPKFTKTLTTVRKIRADRDARALVIHKKKRELLAITPHLLPTLEESHQSQSPMISWQEGLEITHQVTTLPQELELHEKKSTSALKLLEMIFKKP